MSKRTALPAQIPSAPTQALEQHEQEQLALINVFIVTVRRFFGGCIRLFHPIRDPRHPSFTIYPLPAVCFAGMLTFLCRLGSRRQINHMLRGNGPSAAKFQASFGVETCPHGEPLRHRVCLPVDLWLRPAQSARPKVHTAMGGAYHRFAGRADRAGGATLRHDQAGVCLSRQRF
jgi:hypothetical protein